MPHTREAHLGLPPEGALISLAVDADGEAYVCTHFYPPLVEGRHVMTKVEAVAARMLRAAIDAGAREV